MPSRSACYSSIAHPAPRPFFGPPRPRPRVVLLQLQKESFFDDQYATLLHLLKTKADVDSITSRSAASALFNSKYRPVVLATDQGLSESPNAALRDDARQFVRSGGTLILCCHFSNLCASDDATRLFSHFDLAWASGDGACHRAEHDVNPCMLRIDTTALPRRYSPQAWHVRNVDRSDAVYLPTPHLCSPPSPLDGLTHTPAALTAWGRGKLGYLADGKVEDATATLVLAMCGLR